MKFQPGNSGNPKGRPRGLRGGRMQALEALDEMLGRKRNRDALVAALEKALLKDPVLFFRQVVMPLLPKDARLEVERSGIVEWRSLIETIRENGGANGAGAGDEAKEA